MIWPNEVTCHRKDRQFPGEPIFWRAPEPEPRRRGWIERTLDRLAGDGMPPLPDGVRFDTPYGTPFRVCSYCGSIHPEDLYRYLSAPPDPERKKTCLLCLGSTRGWLQHTCQVTLSGSDWKYGWPHKFYVHGIPNPIAGQLVVSSSWSKGDERGWGEPGPAPDSSFAKWYNNHLEDVRDHEAFNALTEVIRDKSGIEFYRDEKGLGYRAPHLGYQR